jgi:hypothetical protein
MLDPYIRFCNKKIEELENDNSLHSHNGGYYIGLLEGLSTYKAHLEATKDLDK